MDDPGEQVMRIIVLVLGALILIGVVWGVLWLRRVYRPADPDAGGHMHAQLLAAREDLISQIAYLQTGGRGRYPADFRGSITELQQALDDVDAGLAALEADDADNAR